MKKAELVESDYPCASGRKELDLTDGCDNGCIYCALSQSGHQSVTVEPLDEADILEGPPPEEGVYISPNSDPFSDSAREATHRVLERFLPAGVPVGIITKRKIPERTVQLLGRYPDLVAPSVSLARLNPELNAYIEPGASTAQERLDTMKALADAGLDVKARLNPLYPGVDDTDESLGEMIRAYADAGVYAVKTAYVVVRDSRRTRWMVEKMMSHPVLSGCWGQMTETIQLSRGKGNVPPYDRRIRLYEKVSRLCNEQGLRFAVCSALDLPVLERRPPGIPVCSDISTFYGQRLRRSALARLQQYGGQ